LHEVDQEAQPVLLDDDRRRGDLSPQGAVVQFQPLELADAALGAQEDALRRQQFHKQFREQLAPLGQSEGGELHHEPAVVAIDRAAGEAVALAEDEPAGTSGHVEAEESAQADGRGEPVAEKVPVERHLRRPGVEADADLAAAVVQAAGDEVAGVGVEIDHLAVGRLALDVVDGAGEDPGMAAVEGPGPARLEDDACGHGPPRSTASMYASARSSSSLYCRLCSSERTRSSSSLLLTGLVRKSWVPASMARSTSLG